MSWALIIGLAAGAYLFKVMGLAAFGPHLQGRALRLASLLPAALLPAIIAVQTFGGAERQVEIDARVAGLAVALVAVWRKAPFAVVVLLAGGVTAGLRALTG